SRCQGTCPAQSEAARCPYEICGGLAVCQRARSKRLAEKRKGELIRRTEVAFLQIPDSGSNWMSRPLSPHASRLFDYRRNFCERTTPAFSSASISFSLKPMLCSTSTLCSPSAGAKRRKVGGVSDKRKGDASWR